MNGVPKIRPIIFSWPIYRVNLRGGAVAQVLAEQVCETERTTKSPPSKSARGVNDQVPAEQVREADNQVPAEQVCKVRRTTKSLPSKFARWNGRPRPR